MTWARIFAATVTVAALQGDVVMAEPETRAGSSVDIRVSTFRNRVGVLGCRLYADGKAFPEGSPWSAQTGGPVSANTQVCHFPNVNPGTYAVAVMHDENRNGQLDKNFIGKPVEGYGVSNNHTYALREPEWAESKFEVKAGQQVQLSVELRY